MNIPSEVQSVLRALHDAGFEAYVVGGCVRDLLLKKTPKDWDVTTNAAPEEIQKIFPKHFYNNRFGTVTLLRPFGNSGGQAVSGGIEEIEVTTYRVDVGYSDQRHPDSVKFTKKLEDDLARRDFTVNAMALGERNQKLEIIPLRQSYAGQENKNAVVIDDMQIIDPFGGLKDLDAKIIRAVGDAKARFEEDALRLLRAVRFAAQLGFVIEEQTLAAVKDKAVAIAMVSQERIRDEVVKIVMSERPEQGFIMLQETGLLKHILPELEEGVGVGQNKHHIYPVFEHNVKSLQFAADFGYLLHVRLATLFHDVGKPRTKRLQGDDYTFYAHEIVGARMTEKILKRLAFSSDMVKQVTHLVRQHMFYYDVDKITEAGVRRLLKRVGPEHFSDLLKLRMAERKGSGVPKARPYRLRHLEFMAEKVAKQPISVGQLKINGHDLMKELGITPGPVIGGVLNALLAEVIEDPKKNKREYLLERAKGLQHEDPAALKKLGMAAAEEEEKRREEEIRRKYHV